MNPGFNQDDFHKLVTTQAARQKMISYLVDECARQGYSGIQFDFENIIETDRDALSVIVREAADALQRAQFQLSIATVPNAPRARRRWCIFQMDLLKLARRLRP